jgi:hypothetical protein
VRRKRWLTASERCVCVCEVAALDGRKAVATELLCFRAARLELFPRATCTKTSRPAGGYKSFLAQQPSLQTQEPLGGSLTCHPAEAALHAKRQQVAWPGQ